LNQKDPKTCNGANSVVCARVPYLPANTRVEMKITLALKGVSLYPAIRDKTVVRRGRFRVVKVCLPAPKVS